jgi:hypothetical protein
MFLLSSWEATILKNFYLLLNNILKTDGELTNDNILKIEGELTYDIKRCPYSHQTLTPELSAHIILIKFHEN